MSDAKRREERREKDTAELERIVEDIQRQQYAYVDSSIEPKLLDDTIDAFLDFLSLSQEKKDKIQTHYVPGDSVGYCRRRKGKVRYDNKELFHYHPILDEHFPELDEIPLIHSLLGRVRLVYNTALADFRRRISTFSLKEPALHRAFFREHEHSRAYLRILKYDEAPIGKTIAAGHYDQGALTEVLRETSPGLRLGTPDSEDNIVQIDGKNILIPGITFDEYTTDIKLGKTWHFAKQTTERMRPGVGRCAIILFVDPIDQRHFSEKETKTYEPNQLSTNPHSE